MSKKLDTAGWFICTLHQMLGHEKARIVIGGEPGDPAQCILCQYEKGEVEKAAVYERLGVEA